MESEEKTLSLVMNKVSADGYNKEFKLGNNTMTLGDESKEYSPQDLIITKSYRFEGESNPDDMAVLYLIHTNDGQKGMLVDAYGTYSSRSLAEFLREVKVDQDEESREA
jgi:hypothetical protein